MNRYSPKEQKILRHFFTNLDRNIFVLINLPEVVKGALFSRYSRSAKDLRRMLLDEFLQEETGLRVGSKDIGSPLQIVDANKAEGFYDRVLVGYGDDSVAELAGVHVACENVSQLIAAKWIEDNRIGISPLEKSTRYVRFDEKDEKGKWKYYIDPDIAASRFKDLYIKTNDMLFQTYSTLIEPLSDYLQTRTPKDATISDRAYANVIKAKACDVLRQLLPCATLTNIGIYGNGRALEYTIVKMLTSPFAEVRKAALELKEELDKVIPSFVKRSTNQRGIEMQTYIKEGNALVDRFAKKLSVVNSNKPTKPFVKLVAYDKDVEDKVLIGFFYDQFGATYSDVKKAVSKMTKKDRGVFFKQYFDKRLHRTHKPGRAFEMTSYVFDIVSTISCYKDVQRHRQLSQYKQQFSADLGFDIPQELIDAGLVKPYTNAMEKAGDAWRKLTRQFPYQSQYVIPIGYHCRFLFKMTLREVSHLSELRSSMQGHPDYRFTAQEIAKQVREVHPLLGTLATHFVDFEKYELSRLEAEKRIDKKLAGLKGGP